MPSLTSTSKSITRLITTTTTTRRRLLLTASSRNAGNCVTNRCFSTGIAGIDTTSSSSSSCDDNSRFFVKDSRRVYTPRFRGGGGGGGGFVQRRGFLGCGDGDEGSNVLSKIHEERRLMGYSPEQLFAVVAAVDMYEHFLPWCQRSDIVRRYPDGSFDAELEIGFKFLVESYVSHVKLDKPKLIKTTSSQSNLFDHLINIWEFNPGPLPGTCDLHFFVDFKFQSPLYRQVASVFFKEVVSRLVSSFNDRCRLIYGPGVPLLENTMEQKS